VKTSGMDIRNHKKRGQWAELRFMAKAIELGFQVAKPLGDSAQYDVIVDLGGRFVRVQIKSTFFQASNLKPGNFVASLFHINGPNRRYERSDFDYLAVYCIPKDIWYIIPSSEASRKHAIRVCPGDELNQWEQYREAWYLLHDRAPAPLQKKNRFDLYGIIEDYVAPPKLRKQKTNKNAPPHRPHLHKLSFRTK
jgi:PD-(D/E)XK endonuclease